MTEFRGIDTGGIKRTSHLAVVTSTENTSATRVYRAGASSYGAAVSASNRHEVHVRAIAAQHDNFEDALPHMVRASGVTGDAARAATKAILANPALKAQAERAYARARINS